MPDLQKERAVAERIASLDALAAAYAEGLVDAVLVVGVLDEGALYGAGGAGLVFGGGGQRVGVGLEIAEAQLAISAHCVGVDSSTQSVAHLPHWTHLFGSICHTISPPVDLLTSRPASAPTASAAAPLAPFRMNSRRFLRLSSCLLLIGAPLVALRGTVAPRQTSPFWLRAPAGVRSR